MADKTKIEWTDATWNIITGCTLVDEGCRNCYAAHLIASWPAIGNHPSRKGLARKNAAGEAKFTGEVRFNEQWLDQPLRWKKPRRIFVCAHGDLFHENVPDEWIDRVFAVMALCPQHTFQVLTKRPDRARTYLTAPGRPDSIESEAGAQFGDEASVFVGNWINGWSRPQATPLDTNPANGTQRRWPMPNVWLGTSVSDQASADARIPHLLATPAALRFLSCEPLLGPVDIHKYLPRLDVAAAGLSDDPLAASMLAAAIADGRGSAPMTVGIDWVIVGGESGPRARPMHPDWARSLRDQCAAAGVPFFFKQWGEWAPSTPEEAAGNPRSGWRCLAGHPSVPRASELYPEAGAKFIEHKGKARAGRLLDGRTHDDTPGVK